jgi:phosphoribulokinase
MTETEILQQIELLAGLFFTIEEISIHLKIDESELRREIRGKHTPRALAYWDGKLNQMIELRKELIDYAKKGSNQADSIVNDLIKKQKTKE